MTSMVDRFPASARVRFAACAVLIVGWLFAAAVYVVSPADVDADAGAGAYRVVGAQAYPSDEASPGELQQLERLGGKAAVLTFRFNRWFASLWSGRRLAVTLAVLSLLAAAAGLRVASLM